MAAAETTEIGVWIASAIARGEIATPCLVFDFHNVHRVLGLFATYLPGVRLYYSVKANDHPEILRYLAEKGLGFDVASVNEIAAALGAGATSDNLILSNTVKTPRCIREIFQHRVWATTVDNERDLNALSLESTFHSFRPRIFARIKLPPIGVDINLNEKFGCSVEQAASLLSGANERGLPAEGVHFHVGTQCRTVESYRAGIETAMSVLHNVEQKAGLKVRTIDIGGGFPDAIVAEESGGLEALFHDLGRIVKDAQKQGFNLIAEPGRIIAAGAGIAVSQVIGRNVHEDREWVYLDDGIYGLFSTAHFEKRRFEFETIGKSKEKTASFVVAGPTCDSLDVIGTDLLLPRSIQAGDFVVAHDAGAYSISVKSNFNGMGDISTKVSGHALAEVDKAIIQPAAGE